MISLIDTFTFNKNRYTNELLHSSPPKGAEAESIMDVENHSALPMVCIQRRFAMSGSCHGRILLYVFFIEFCDLINYSINILKT